MIYELLTIIYHFLIYHFLVLPRSFALLRMTGGRKTKDPALLRMTRGRRRTLSEDVN